MGKVPIIDLLLAGLNFLNLKEARSNKLSLTNIAVAVCIVKVAMAPQASIVDLGALLLSLMNYMHKRNENNKAQKVESETNNQDAITEVKEAVEKVVNVQNSITQDMVQIKQTFTIVEKNAEETKALLSKHNIAQAFKR